MKIGSELSGNIAANSRGGCCGAPNQPGSQDTTDETGPRTKNQENYCTGCKGAGAASGPGMKAPSYNFGLANANIQFSDIPIWYPSGKGPDMAVYLAHSRTDARNGADYTNVNYFCFGNKWSFNLLSFSREAPSTNVTIILPAGRHEEYYRTNSNAYIPKDTKNKNTLVVTGEYSRLTFDLDDSVYSFWTNNEKLATIEDRYGNLVTCSYSNSAGGTGWLTNVVDYAGRYFSFKYDAQGCITNVSDILDRNSSFVYSNGNLVSMTDMGGYTTLLSYNTNNWITNIVYPNSNVLKIDYADGSQLGDPYAGYSADGYPAFRIRTVDSLNRTNEYFYHAFETLGPVTVKDYAGNSWLYGHDADYPYPYITSDSVNEGGDSMYTRKGSQWVRRVYTADGDNIAEVHYATSPHENVLGNKTYGSYVTNNISRYFAYDTNDWLTSQTWKTNGITCGVWSNAYDSAGNLVWSRDALSNVTTIAYDSKRNITAITNALGDYTRMGYNSDGTLAALTNARGYAVLWNYDSKGFNTNVVFPDNTINTMTYDLAGRMLTFRDATGLVISNQHDNLDRTTNIFFSSDSTSMKYEYDFSGLTKITDRLGRQTSMGRDVVGRVSSVTNALANVVSFTYGLNDELTQILVGMGSYTNTTRFNYTSTNGFTRLTSRIMPSGKTNNVYSYTFRGWLSNRADGYGRNTAYTQDALGRLVRTSYGENTNVDLSYNLLGNVTQMVDQCGTSQYGTNSFVYNALNVLTNTTVTTAIEGFSNISYQLAYRFDSVGNLTNLVLTGITGFTNVISTAYTYDNMNRLTLVSNSLAQATYQMDTAGRLSSKTYGNGDETRYNYDNESRLTSLVTSNSGANVQGWYYGYNAMGLITNITNSVSTRAFQYDSIYQLTRETLNSTNTDWTYDRLGNRLTGTDSGAYAYYSYSRDNELLARTDNAEDWITVTGTVDPGSASNKWYYSFAGAGGQVARVSTNDGSFSISNVPVFAGANSLVVSVQDITGNVSNKTVTFTKDVVDGALYAWDLNGNPTNIMTGTNKLVLAYDLENRLTQVTSNGVVILKNWYDGIGRRVAKQEVIGSTTNKYLYVYSGWTCLAVLNGTNGVMLESYTRGAGIGGDVGSIVAATHYTGSFTNGTFYYNNNHRGDVTCVRSGTVTVATYDYKAYGETRSSTGSYSSRYRFSSKEYEATLGIYYYGYRFYRPETGTWLTQDPLKEWGSGINQFRFCNGNPICFIDILGLKTYLYLIGQDNKGLPLDKAAKYLSGKLSLGADDKVVIQHINGFNDFNNALINNTDIAEINYLGHGGVGVLFVGTGKDPDTNISESGGDYTVFGETFHSRSVNELCTDNVRRDATITLYACYSGFAGVTVDSIARSFGKHFGVKARGGIVGTKFDANGRPYTFGGYITQWR